MREILTTVLEDPAAWRGDGMAKRSDWVIELEDAMVEELEAAVAAVAGRGIGIFDTGQEDFPLPRSGRLFAAMLAELEGGAGLRPPQGASRQALERGGDPHRALGARHPPRPAGRAGSRREPPP